MPFKWRGKYRCFYCGKEYMDYPDFRKHTKSHGLCSTKDYSLKIIKGNHIEIKVDISELSCEICSESFSNFDDILDHLIDKHHLDYDKNVDVPYQQYRLADSRCQYCGMEFTYFGSLVSHINLQHPQNFFICHDCGATHNKKRDLACHIRSYHREGGYTCKQCPLVFNSLPMLRRHQNALHFRSCNKCGSSFASYILLQKHKALEHPMSESLKCEYCTKKFHTKLGLKHHSGKCKVKMVVMPDPMDTKEDHMFSLVEPKEKRNLARIRENIQCVLNMSTVIPFKFFAKFSCFYCSIKFGEYEDLKQHTVTEHPVCDASSKNMKRCKGESLNIKIDILELACKICGEPADNVDIMIDHLLTIHKADYDRAYPVSFEQYKLTKDNIPCLICDKTFRYFSILLKHINAEHNDNQRICAYCGRSFKNITNLEVHIKYSHTLSIECDLCHLKFKNKWCYDRHRAKIHDAKDFKCPKCPEFFESQYHKQKHLIKIHNIGHKCSYCERMFTRNSFMKDHIRRTHLKEKNVACSVCNERFFDNYLLRMHMVKHNGERKFVCAICDKAFLRRSNLQSHREMHKKYGHVQ